MPLGYKHTKEALIKLRKPRPKAVGRKAWNEGLKLGPLSLERRIKAGEKNFGVNNPNWKGGITPTHLAIRQTMAYKLWREAVYKRDNYTCIQCGIKGDINSPFLQADHIKPFYKYPELRLELSNGRTLCLNCHSQTDSFRHRARWDKTAS